MSYRTNYPLSTWPDSISYQSDASAGGLHTEEEEQKGYECVRPVCRLTPEQVGILKRLKACGILQMRNAIKTQKDVF